MALNGLVEFPPLFSRTKADKREENPGDLTSTLIGVGSCSDLRRRLGESFVLDKALVFGEYIFSARYNFSAKFSLELFTLSSNFLRLVWRNVTALLQKN